MELVPVRGLPNEVRHAAADRIRAMRDFQLPDLTHFNSSPCDRHGTLDDGMAAIPPCRRCGIRFRRHQRIGVAWLYMRGHGLIADQVGPQPLDAQVLTPTGYRNMGDLAVGDAVIDPEGSPSVVTGVFPQGRQAVYRLTFSDGTWAESTENHLWRVRGPIEPYLTRVGREPRDGEVWHVRSLQEIGSRVKASAVPLITVPPDFDQADLPLDPYVLGLLLGDGSLASNVPEFLSADQELLDAVQAFRPTDWGWTRRADRTGCQIYALNGSQPLLRQLGLFGKHSWDKAVPLQYKWASAATRLAVLQGLMDTDGNWATGSAEFTSVSEQLALDVADLARSLGLRVAGPRRRKTSYTYKGERREGRPAYRVSIAESGAVRVFRLARKLRQQPRQRVRGDLENAGARTHWRRDQQVKWIRTVEYVRTSEVQCISVSAPSHLYVTDNWTVTHNTGKTAQAAGLIAVIKQIGELDKGQRVIVVCRAAAVDQWAQELRRFLPDTDIVTAEGPRAKRVDRYVSRWEVLVTGSQMFIRDADLINHFTLSTLVVDDVDPLRNPKSQTAIILKRAARFADRVAVLTGTPLQKKLQELHSICDPIGGQDVFGSPSRFARDHVREELVKVYSPTAGRHVLTRRTVGYKNLDTFVQKLAPLTLRRTPAHIDDVDLPVIQPHDIYLDLTPQQKARYEYFRKGVLILRQRGETITRAVASAAFIYGGKICAGLNTLGEDDGPGMSAKLDWVLDAVTDGDLSDEKVVVFCHFTDTVEALTARLDKAGVGNVRIWGREPDRKARTAARDRFWDDPACRVLVGTEAIEQSLNLQVSRHLVNVDQLMNPARMQQLAGRIRRDGSAYRSVYVHNLLARGTQEEGYMNVLAREQALSDMVWGEANQLYEALPPLALLDLIGGVR